MEVNAEGFDVKNRIKTCSRLLDQCLSFFEQKSNHPSLHLVVFISWINFTDWLNDGNRTKKKKDLLKILGDTNSGCIVIDDIENMKEKTILNFNTILTNEPVTYADTDTNTDTNTLDLAVPFQPSQEFPDTESTKRQVQKVHVHKEKDTLKRDQVPKGTSLKKRPSSKKSPEDTSHKTRRKNRKRVRSLETNTTYPKKKRKSDESNDESS